METSLKTGFAQIFSCCPKTWVAQNFFGGAAAALVHPPPRPVRLWTFRQDKEYDIVYEFFKTKFICPI